MNTRKFAVLTLALASASLMAQTKVGFVYVSPVGDAGYTYQHDLGRKQLEADLKGTVTTKFVDNVPEGADAERVIRELAQEGCKVVFTTSFGYMNPTLKVAAAFPNTVFMHATGYKTGPNMGQYNARFYEGRYLCGVIAGKMTKKNVAGYVAAFPIPEVLQGINAFTAGMKSVNPKAEVRVVWINSWFDPTKEREAALTLISSGADMITHHSDSPAVVQACEEKSAYCFGYNSDFSKYAPKMQLTASTTVWGDYYVKVVKDVLANKWKTGFVWGGIKDGMVKLAPLSPAVPKAVKDLVAKTQADIVSGKLHPFHGPLMDQDGKTLVPAGQNMSDEDLNKMNYFIQGVASKLPKS